MMTMMRARDRSVAAVSTFLTVAAALAMLTALAGPAAAAERFVGVEGRADGAGTKESPWDIASALGGRQKVEPGDAVLLLGGTYRRRPEALFDVRLIGEEDDPIHVRPAPGARAIIDGGLSVVSPSAHLWVHDLEILV
ncbi:MAG: hypothetical protein JXA90_05605, partial [Planctomycetes bacterium]|nr:hypothetical protein [Planctomycetota bacterium]